MLADLPAEVQEILKSALQQLGDVLIDTNRQLAEKDPDFEEEYGTVAATLFYNDPEAHAEFPTLSILLPADVPFEEGVDPSVTIATDVAIHDKDPRNTQHRVLFSSFLTTGCTETLCCGHGRKRCKRRALGLGMGYELRCKFDSGCPSP
jgi:hypothetical protein